MAAKPKGKKPIDDDEDLELEPFGGALKDEFADLARRGKSAMARRARLQEKLARLLNLDPKQEAEARSKDHDACIAAARKRMEKLRAAHLKAKKKAPPASQADPKNDFTEGSLEWPSNSTSGHPA